MTGQVWLENSRPAAFVIEQAVATLLHGGRPFEPWFLRTLDGYEVDLLLDFGSERWAVEIKLTTQPTAADGARQGKAADMAGAERRFPVSRTLEPLTTGATWSCGVERLLDALQQGVG